MPRISPVRVSPLDSSEPVRVVVCGDGEQAVGIVVDQILDIVQAEYVVRRSAGPGLLFGSAVVGGKITDFLDLPAMTGVSGENRTGTTEVRRRGLSVLVATGSGVGRGMVRAYLEMAGHCVGQAHSAADAIRLSGTRRWDAVLVGSDLRGSSGDTARGSSELLQFIRSSPLGAGVPVVALAMDEDGDSVDFSAFDGWQSGLDRETMLTSLERLAGSVGRPIEEACGREEVGSASSIR